ncbi:DUF7617 domain-containing protein [Lysinibacter cavernae]|uniref:DUF7617 domain-containing protein n=1 Tax=Lysinibacter cavernae TaxID=1640652 RepID=A0A7X5R1K4_9MICO|nr:hypothetical protein [Lysinibacter cavernae]NIH54000.1 hypothetical protein [Lysinibacter cavernae]
MSTRALSSRRLFALVAAATLCGATLITSVGQSSADAAGTALAAPPLATVVTTGANLDNYGNTVAAVLPEAENTTLVPTTRRTVSKAQLWCWPDTTMDEDDDRRGTAANQSVLTPRNNTSIGGSVGSNPNVTAWIIDGDSIQYSGETATCNKSSEIYGDLDGPFDITATGSPSKFLEQYTTAPVGDSIASGGSFWKSYDVANPVVSADGKYVFNGSVTLGPYFLADAVPTRIWFGSIPGFSDMKYPNPGIRADSSDSAYLSVAQPGMSVAKQACIYSGHADADTLCDVENHDAWSNDVVVPEGATVYWRVSVINTGNLPLVDIAVAAGADCTNLTFGASLAVGAVESLRCETAGVSHLPTGEDSPVTVQANVQDQTRPGVFGQGQSVGERYRAAYEALGQDALLVSTDSANVRTGAADIQLVVEVCVPGTACDEADDSQWVKHSIIPVGSDVAWRLSVTNSGTLNLADVAIGSDALSGGTEDAAFAACLVAIGDGTLAVDETKRATCTTPTVTATQLKTINTAQATATPVDELGVQLPAFERNSVKSNTDAASVIPVPAKISVTQQVCTQSDLTLCDPADDGLWVDSQELPSGSSAMWRMTVTNEGGVGLSDVTVTVQLTGSLTGEAVSCRVILPGTLAVGETSAPLTCSTEDIPDGELVAAVSAVGTPVAGTEAAVESPVVEASVTLKKDAVEPPEDGGNTGGNGGGNTGNNGGTGGGNGGNTGNGSGSGSGGGGTNGSGSTGKTPQGSAQNGLGADAQAQAQKLAHTGAETFGLVLGSGAALLLGLVLVALRVLPRRRVS